MFINSLRFFSVWVLLLHALAFLKIIGNTFSLGVFVTIGWAVLSFGHPNWHKQFPNEFVQYLPRDILIHIVPLLFLPKRFDNLHYIPYALLPYLIITPIVFGPVTEIYKNPYLY